MHPKRLPATGGSPFTQTPFAALSSEGLPSAPEKPPANPQEGPPDDQRMGATWEFPEWGKFGKDPVKASREVAAQVIQEFQQRKRA